MYNKHQKGKQNPKGKGFQGKDNYKGHPKTDSVETSTTKEPAKEVESFVGATNDPKWYNRNARLIADASKIPFANQIGGFVKMSNDETHSGEFSMSDFRVAGIIALKMVNTPGLAVSASDGVNLAAAGLFQTVRKNLSTVAGYSAADVMMYALGIDAIYSLYSNIARAFGIVNAYSAVNLYMPDALLQAGYGFTDAAIVDFKANINSYRSRFNNLIFKASTLYLPTDFTVTMRHSWLYSNYFLDGNSAKAQMYIHRMMGVHKLQEYQTPQGTMLEYVPLTTDGAATMETLLDTFDICVEVYRNSDSMLKIAADMRRAFEGRKSWQLAYIDEQYVTLPCVDANVCSQIMNTTVYPETMYEWIVANANTGATGWSISQSVNKNTLCFNPTFVYPTATPDLTDALKQWAVLEGRKLLNFYKDDVTTDDILEATRNTLAGYREVVDTNTLCKLRPFGVDICVGLELIDKHFATGAINKYDQRGSALSLGMPGVSFVIWSSAFSYLPLMFTPAQDDPGYAMYPLASLENYTSIDNQVLSNLNNNVMCSMWSIPEFGAIS